MLTKKIIFVYGPTASGKTDFVDRLAQYVSIEVINMDSAQFYLPLNIGTAKPDWKNTPFRQHMFDCIDTPETITVSEYYQQVKPLIKDIQDRGHIPVLVGGSGFYLKSLIFPIKSSNDPAIIQNKSPNKEAGSLWHDLNAIDPCRAQELHPHDLYRINRALHIWYTTGVKPSLYKPEYNPIAPFTLFITHRHPDDLYTRIKQRVHVMIRNGWTEEVKSLMGTPWQEFIGQKGFIGYNDLVNYIKGEMSLDHAIALIQQKTLQYARKQRSFGRMITREINEAVIQSGGQRSDEVIDLNLTSIDLDLYIKQLLHKLY